jgi:enamine deaminase RidA (YjgF/YER057c/UK114 family)
MTQASPHPQGQYVPATRHGALIFTAGMTPRRDGVLQATGPVSADAPLESYRAAVELACENAIYAAASLLAEGERLDTVLSMTIYVLAEAGFIDHAAFADMATACVKRMVPTSGLPARTTVGVFTLPSEAPVEIQLIAAA